MQSVCNISNCFSRKRTAYFVYDIEGNLTNMIIDVPHDSIVKQRYKRLDYYYDLVSGKVNELIYQNDSIDEFIHSYEYDADRRVTDVMTSRDSLFWEHDAGYEYYDHGLLAREIVGRRQVQGIDYVYELMGWIKGVNSSIMNPSYDMGHDGDVHSTNNTVARDAYGFTLNYFNGDYRSIASTNLEATGLPITSLYNGNITGATYSIDNLSPGTVGYIYNYDQLNRYVGDSVFKNPGTNSWTTRTGINDLKEKVSYDENGNILVYLRHGNTMNGGAMAMDSLTYHYTKGRNQLKQVNDAVGSSNYTVDIDNETSNRNYQYNGIGELAKDSAGGLDTIIWNISGKIREIKKHNGDSIVLFYDPLGNRLEKRYYPHSAQSDTTKYTRDAKGYIMAIYYRKKDTVTLTEWDIYGGKRIGSLDTLLRMQKPSTGAGTIDSLTIAYLEGQKQYELVNNIGNVLATISDKKIPVDTISTDTLAKYYFPVVVNAQDYYPFGMEQPGRTYLLNGDSIYSFGFNDKLRFDQLYGTGNADDYGDRIHDDRLGDWLTIDKEFNKAPFQSPYSFAQDNPIAYLDPDGKSVVLAGDNTKKEFSDRLDKVFSGDLQQYRANFEYKQIGTRSNPAAGKDQPQTIPVMGFVFVPTKDVPNADVLFKNIQNSNLTDDQKQLAVSYAVVISYKQIFVIDNNTETTATTKDNNALHIFNPINTEDQVNDVTKYDPNSTDKDKNAAINTLTNSTDEKADYAIYESTNRMQVDIGNQNTTGVKEAVEIKGTDTKLLDDAIKKLVDNSPVLQAKIKAPEGKKGDKGKKGQNRNDAGQLHK